MTPVLRYSEEPDFPARGIRLFEDILTLLVFLTRFFFSGVFS
jgi:hypothetical protein